MATTPEFSLDELLQSWTLTLRAERKSPTTIKTYTDGIAAYRRWCIDKGHPLVLDRTQVKAFVADLLDAGKSASTAGSRLLSLKRFSAWCLDEGEIPADPLIGLKSPKLDTKVVEPLTDDQLRDLLNACKGTDFLARRDTAIVRYMLDSAARAEDVISLNVDDLDLAHGHAIVRRGKGGKGRIVPLGPKTVAAIDRYQRARRGHRLASTPPLWLGDRGKGFSYWGLDYALRKRAQKAGITGFHLHKMRNTASHRWLAKGGSEQSLMAIAGWTRPDMITRYTQARAADRAIEESRRLDLDDL